MGKKTPPPKGAIGGPSPKKARHAEVPDVSEMGGLVSASGSVTRSNLDGSICMALFKYCSDGSVYDPAVFDTDDLVYLATTSGGQPNVLFMLKRVIELHGEATKNTADPAPVNLDELEIKYNAKYQFVGKKTEDKDAVVWRKYGSGFFISGGPDAVKAFLMYYDDIIAWRCDYSDETFEPIAEKPKIFLHVPADYPLELDPKEDELKCLFEIQKDAAPQLSVFDVPPPTFPHRIVVMTFQLVSSTVTNIIFSGNTKPFQTQFAGLGIKGKGMQVLPDDKFPEFFRCIEDRQLTKAENLLNELKNILGAGCLKSSPVIVRIKPTKYDTANAKKIFEGLADCKNVRMDV
jgi:hypothetical protein